MDAFRNSKSNGGRGKTSCGYCRTSGHSIKECPYIKYDHDEWRAFRVPHKSPTLTTPMGRWAMGDYSYWIKQIDKYYPKWEKWQQPQASTGKRVTSPRKCGFCRGSDHTRKDCTEMQRIYKDLLQANRNYRQSLYDTLVVNLGLGVGAVIKVQETSGYYNNKQVTEKLSTVEALDMDSANLFLAEQNYQLDSDYKGNIRVALLGGNGGYYGSPSINLKQMIDAQGRNIAEGTSGYYSQVTYVETIAPSKTPLDPEWVDRDADAFEWLLKKRSKAWLEDRGLLKVIDRWK